MFEAYVRVKGTEDWRPVTWNGTPFRASHDLLAPMVSAMRSRFQNNEYAVRPV